MVNWLLVAHYLTNNQLTINQSTSESSSVGRALASQAEGRGFESRLSLFFQSHF